MMLEEFQKELIKQQFYHKLIIIKWVEILAFISIMFAKIIKFLQKVFNLEHYYLQDFQVLHYSQI